MIVNMHVKIQGDDCKHACKIQEDDCKHACKNTIKTRPLGNYMQLQNRTSNPIPLARKLGWRLNSKHVKRSSHKLIPLSSPRKI